MTKGTTSAEVVSSGGLLPDINFLKEQIPIRDVAGALGLAVRGRKVQCWHTMTHFASVDIRTNKAKCFHCGTKPQSTVDLVMSVRDLSIGEAIRWLDHHFHTTPRVRRRITSNKWGLTKYKFVGHLKVSAPASHEISIDRFVRSPGWSDMPHAARSLATKLLTMIPFDTRCISTSYGQLQRRMGLGSRTTLSRALTELETIGLIVRGRAATGRETPTGWATAQTLLKLTWCSPRFQNWLACGYKLPDARDAVGRATGLTVHFMDCGEGVKNGR